MGGLSLSVHPLFFALGFYYAATGRIFGFLICTLTAAIHEAGHSFAAGSCGYRLNKIVLMPFGAVVKGNIDGLKPADEIKIALAGPLVNLGLGLGFAALWWIFPESYAFTDTAAEANFSMALVNFIPAYPLDGGRILFAIISEKTGAVKAAKICKALGGALGVLLFALFIISCFHEVNVSLCFFAAFVLFGAFSRTNGNVYVKAYTAVSEEKLMRGMRIKRFALHKSATLKKAISLLEPAALNEIVVYGDETEGRLGTLTQERIGEIIESGASLYSEIGGYLAKKL